jgi:signal transduction histidine kinase
LADNINLNAYKIVQEALINISRHAEATAVSVRINLYSNDKIESEVAVKDNGKGYYLRLTNQQRFRFVGIRERIAAIGGSFDLRPATSSSARTSAILPLSSQEGKIHP